MSVVRGVCSKRERSSGTRTRTTETMDLVFFVVFFCSGARWRRFVTVVGDLDCGLSHRDRYGTTCGTRPDDRGMSDVGGVDTWEVLICPMFLDRPRVPYAPEAT